MLTKRRSEIDARLIATASFLSILFLLGSIFFTGSPLIGIVILVGLPIFVYLCLEPKRLVFAEVIYCCFYKVLISEFGMPTSLNYVTDILVFSALFFAVTNRQRLHEKINWGFCDRAILAFSIGAVVSALLNAVAPILFIWAVRNTFRFFSFFYCCVVFLDKSDIRRLIKFLIVLFFLNAAYVSYQVFSLGLGTDNANGFFGTESGGNATLALSIMVACTYAIFAYIDNKISLIVMLSTLAVSFYIAVITDLKVFFIIFALIIVLTVLFCRPTVKQLALVIGGPAVLFISIALFSNFSGVSVDFFTVEGITEYAGSSRGYANDTMLNRFTAIPTLEDLFMDSDLKKLIGLGFGSGQYSQFFESPLYAMWGETLRWSWFTDALIFLEVGWFGLIAYCAFYIGCTFRSVKAGSEVDEKDQWIMRASATISILCLVMIVYNCLLSVDPGGYLAMFFLAVPFIFTKSHRLIRWGNESQSINHSANL